MIGVGKAWQGVRFAGIAAAAAGLRAVDPAWARSFLVRQLGTLPGLPAKFGQLIAGGGAAPDAAPAPEPMPLARVRSLIEERSPALAREIAEIDPLPRTASIGQVHRVRTHGGEELAVKLRYPGVQEALGTQLELLMAGFRRSPGARLHGMDAEGYRRVITEAIEGELDYASEAENQRLARSRWSTLPGVRVPRVRGEWSGEAILVQDWEACRPSTEAGAAPPEVRRVLAASLAGMFLPLPRVGAFVHGDLHPANWGFRVDPVAGPQLVIYDFGACLRIDAAEGEAWVRLASGEAGDGIDAWAAAGFGRAALEPLGGRLPSIAAVLFRPFRACGDFDYAAWDPGDQLRASLDVDARWRFRSAGPPELLFALRAYTWFFRALVQTGSREPLRTALGDRGWKVPIRTAEGGAPGAAPRPGGATSTACALRVRVSEADGTEVVALELPPSAALDLAALLSDETLSRIREAGLDLDAIQARAAASGLAPQTLFEASRGGRRYRVWLA
jgi:hypothetical protein